MKKECGCESNCFCIQPSVIREREAEIEDIKSRTRVSRICPTCNGNIHISNSVRDAYYIVNCSGGCTSFEFEVKNVVKKILEDAKNGQKEISIYQSCFTPIKAKVILTRDNPTVSIVFEDSVIKKVERLIKPNKERGPLSKFLLSEKVEIIDSLLVYNNHVEFVDAILNIAQKIYNQKDRSC